MTSHCSLPDLDQNQVALVAERLFGLTGEMHLLAGERDLNFLIDHADGKVIFKIANQNEDIAMLQCQHEVFDLLHLHYPEANYPQSMFSTNNQVVESFVTESGASYFCRAVRYIDGTLFSAVNPRNSNLLQSLGSSVARIDKTLQEYDHNALQRPLLWDMQQAISVLDQFQGLIKDRERRNLIAAFRERFENNVLAVADQLRVGCIHNDANDNNIIVDLVSPDQQTVKAIIDFGDMVRSWIAVDPAIAAAYALLNEDKPLDVACQIVAGYYREFALTEIELSVMFELICMRLCMSVCICAYQKSLNSDNTYLAVSEQPAWAALEKLQKISPSFAHYAFRDACGLQPVPNTARVKKWLGNYPKPFSSIIDGDLSCDSLLILDASVGSPELQNPSLTFDPYLAARTIFRAMEDNNCIAAIGRYDEYRLIYRSDDFIDETGYRRTLHLGIDIFMPEGANLYAPLDGSVYGVANNDAPYDYGGTLILQHDFEDDQGSGEFFTLYGHLKPDSVAHLVKGQKIKASQKIAEMGGTHENGNWAPHVHFEIVSDLLGSTDTFVGVGSHRFRNVWLGLCPDPNIILAIDRKKLEIGETSPEAIAKDIQQSRIKSLSPCLSLSYQKPIHMVRGSMQYLYDYTGRQYLDAVNNVPHVGHCHPLVVQAEQQQSSVLTTNTRYLYSQIKSYSERLLDKFPDVLDVCFLVNSGSEANDLALRLARNFNHRNDIVVVDHAYHGNLTSLIDISPYKHNSAGGMGAPNHVHTISMPDSFRADYNTKSYMHKIQSDLENIDVSAFICESILGCGGQVVLPENYLKSIYRLIRNQGGLCIADEVQVGFGRVGRHFWAFESQNVVPDIVTLGKPIGNGYPLAAVITRREIADAFNNGMEYFNTFGGNPVSCAIGHAVLDVIEKEQLQENALRTGQYFLAQLKELQFDYPIMGEVRGLGLFIGVELVNDEALTPAKNQASYIAERMKQNGILISTDGPLHNVLKIKPPICFSCENVDRFILVLRRVLQETFSQPR